MEEEKKEEVLETREVTEPVSTVEPVVTTNEVKEEKKKKKGKGGIIVLVILLILALGAGGFFAYKYFTKEDKSKEDGKTDTTINFELKQVNNETELYVNGKKVDGVSANGVTKDHIYHVKDALLVVECFDTCGMKMVDKDGKVFKEIKGKLTDGGTNFTELKDNDIYFSSYAEVFYQDGSLLCKFKDDDIVYVEEKITYLGNKSFSEQQEINSMTKKEYLKDRTINCSSETPKEETNKISYNLTNTTLYVNNKKIDPDGSGSFETSKDNIYDLGDLLLVGDCRSTCEWYFIDANATIVGSLGDDSTFATNKKSLVTHKFPVIVIDKVVGKDIYFTDWSYSTQDASSICEFGENDAVYANEKVTYNGNNKFSSTTTITTKTRAQISKEDGRFAIDCSEFSH